MYVEQKQSCQNKWNNTMNSQWKCKFWQETVRDTLNVLMTIPVVFLLDHRVGLILHCWIIIWSLNNPPPLLFHLLFFSNAFLLVILSAYVLPLLFHFPTHFLTSISLFIPLRLHPTCPPPHTSSYFSSSSSSSSSLGSSFLFLSQGL